MNIKFLAILLFILYIFMLFYTYYYRTNIENFIDLLTNNNVKSNIQLDTKVNTKTYIKRNIKNIKSKILYLELNKDISYFYNSSKDKYMICTYNIFNYQKELILTNLDNEVIGNLINEIYNKIILKINYYKTNIIVEYLNNYNKIKIYLENDDKFFYIYKNNSLYNIDVYQLNIGYITLDKDNMYKISVEEKYKKYLNLFALGFILLLNN